MRIFILAFCTLFFLEGNAQQHSDLYISADSLIKNVFHYNGKIDINQPYIRKGHIDPRVDTMKVRPLNSPDPLGPTPMIVFLSKKNKSSSEKYTTLYLGELDALTKADIDSLVTLQAPSASAIFGYYKGRNGAICFSSKKDISKKIKAANDQDISFVEDNIEITIKKSVPDKFFWKQLILNDPYFCRQLLPDTTRKGIISISSCIEIEGTTSFKIFEMNIYEGYKYTEEEISRSPGIISSIIRPPRKYRVVLNSYRSYVYDIRPEGGVEL